MKLFNVISFLVIAMLYAGTAEAKRSQRGGFNFGTTFRLINDSDKRFAGEETDKNSTTKTHTQSISPFFGFVLNDFLNLGIVSGFEQQSKSSTEVNSETDAKAERYEDTNLRNLSLYMRFLFGGVMFFEGGFGIYDRKINVNNEYTSSSGDGVFTGNRESYRQHGVGPGYHLGGGVELPITNGFYIAGMFVNRIYNLRGYRTETSDIGRRQARVQKQEFSFGISYYLK